MKRPGDSPRVVPRTLTPFGEVSPIRIVSLPWPVSCSARHATSTIPRYTDGEPSTHRPRLRTHCGSSHPGWLGSFWIVQ